MTVFSHLTPAFARTLYTQYPHHRLSLVPALIYRTPNRHRFTLRTRLRTQRASSLPLTCPLSLVSDHSGCSQGPVFVARDPRYPFSSFRSLPNITPLKRPKIALFSHHPLPHNSPSPLCFTSLRGSYHCRGSSISSSLLAYRPLAHLPSRM